jgi:hypothetical protein
LARIVEIRKEKCLRMWKQSEYFSSLSFFWDLPIAKLVPSDVDCKNGRKGKKSRWNPVNGGWPNRKTKNNT